MSAASGDRRELSGERDEPVRVCMVLEHHEGASMGGAEYQANLLATELCSRPQVHLTYLTRGTPPAQAVDRYRYSIRSIGNDTGIRRRAVLFDALELWRALVALRPHVIYQRCRLSYTAVCSHYARRFGIPFVFHIAGESDLLPGWRLMRLSGNFSFDVLESVAGAWGLRRATDIVAQTQRQKRLLASRFHREVTEVIANFQPLTAQLPRKIGTRVRVIWVGNVKPVKRAELFVDLAERFAQRPDIEFVLIGRRPTRSSLDARAPQIAGLKNLRLTGELPLAEVHAEFDAADILVNTSEYEGFPNTFIQAWSRGVVVTTLSFDVDQGLEAQGIGFCAGSLERLTTLIDRLSRSEQERTEIAARAFTFVHARHSLANAGKLADLLLGAAERARPHAGDAVTPRPEIRTDVKA